MATKTKGGVGGAGKPPAPHARVLSMPLAKLRADRDVQSRAHFDEAVATDYAEALEAGTNFPAAIVFHDADEGAYYVADGFTRRRAHELAGRKHMLCEVHDGTKRDAILFAAGANAAHGLRRTNEDKRHAVMKLLNDPEWRTWSDRQIAETCGVDKGTVAVRRKELEDDERAAAAKATGTAGSGASGESHQMRTVTRGGTTYTMDTSGQRASGAAARSGARDLVDAGRAQIAAAAKWWARDEYDGAEYDAERVKRIRDGLAAVMGEAEGL